ncbi:hypothetical protein DU500_03540 [Haloplanus rubicundus]|uniref:Nitrite/sulphite reductase 4Fe-4S domain-containing protein n=1 Tax=Haloplanus rubicundus TaxID=1547898 RepID=A0A345E060_9EURY|nr:hypothetical protein DU500_03540 [Haloplanus rubicundus]
MPRKFNIGVTRCREGCAQDAIDGIGLEPAEKEVNGAVVTGFNVRIGGGLGGREPRRARDLDVFVTRENAYEVGRGFVELYHEHGRRDNRQGNRSRFFIDEEGTEAIRDRLQAEYVDIDLHRAGQNVREAYTYNAGKPPAAGKADHVGRRRSGRSGGAHRVTAPNLSRNLYSVRWRTVRDGRRGRRNRGAGGESHGGTALSRRTAVEHRQRGWEGDSAVSGGDRPRRDTAEPPVVRLRGT